MEQTTIDPAQDDDLTVEELETRVKTNPTDLFLQKELAYSLLDRFVYGAEGHESGNKNDLKRLRRVVLDLPEPMATIPRAFLFIVDREYKKATQWLVRSVLNATDDEPLTCDLFMEQIVERLWEAPSEVWGEFATALDEHFPGSSIVDLLRAWALDDNPDDQAGFLIAALGKDPACWKAAWDLGDIYYFENNWETAAVYYCKALEQEAAQNEADLLFDYAWCLSKLRRYAEEEVQLRKCLILDPQKEQVRNCLGLCLHRQGRFDEALKQYDEAISVGLDGRYPYRNRAKTLEKLGRLDEAIAAWRTGTTKGLPPRWMQQQISRLENLIALKEKVEKSGKSFQPPVPLGDDESDESEDEETEGKVTPAPSNRPSKGVAVQKEELLEESIQQLILRGATIFGRQLQLVSQGRQYPLPGIGRIDLLAEDLSTGEYVVIELKRDESHDEVVGQISTYMVWVRENLAKESAKGVVGIVCVFAASPKLRLAVKGVQGLELFEYGFNFEKIN